MTNSCSVTEPADHFLYMHGLSLLQKKEKFKIDQIVFADVEKSSISTSLTNCISPGRECHLKADLVHLSWENTEKCYKYLSGREESRARTHCTCLIMPCSLCKLYSDNVIYHHYVSAGYCIPIDRKRKAGLERHAAPKSHEHKSANRPLQ